MGKLILFFVSLVQMCLITGFWIILGLEWREKVYKTVLFIVLSAVTITVFLPQISILGYHMRYVVYLAIFLIAKGVFAKSFKETVVDLFFILFVFYCIQTTQILLYRSIYPSIEMYYLNITCFSSIFFMNFMAFIFFMIIYSSKKLTELFIDYKRILGKNPGLIVMMAVTIILMQIGFDIYSEVLWEKFYVFFPIIWILFFLNFIGIKKSLEVFEHKKEIELHKKHYDIISEMLEDAKRREHEFKNHLTTIYCLHQLGEEDDGMKEYIKSVSKSVTIAPPILKLKNKIIAAVIYNKIRIANENDIIFEYYLDHTVSFPIADYQLVEIISNLLNNAFEALQYRRDIPEKRVILEIDSENDNPYILVKNNGKTLLPSEIPFIFKQGFSKKSRGRGYGLYNVKRIVEKNNGQIEVFLENEYTLFKILF